MEISHFKHAMCRNEIIYINMTSPVLNEYISITGNYFHLKTFYAINNIIIFYYQ
jgi:hypothetical protein